MNGSPTAFAALFAAHPAGAGCEWIVRTGDTGTTATLRVDGCAPRVFAARGDAAEELVPGADPGLPGRQWLAEPAALAAAVAPWVGPLAQSRLVAWRPGRRAVVRLLGADGRVHWLKLLDRKGHTRAQAVFAALGTPLAPLVLCTPQAVFAEAAAHLAPAAAGTALRELLGGAGTLDATLLARGVLALAYTPAGALPVHDFAVARAATRGQLARGVAACPALAGLDARIAALASPPPVPPGLVHGDLHDKQLFLGAGVQLIDLEGLACGDPRFDAANLVEHVRLRDLQLAGRDGGFADVLAARCGLDPTAVGTRAFRALVRARLAGVYALRPRWHDLTRRLAAESLALCADLP